VRLLLRRGRSASSLAASVGCDCWCSLGWCAAPQVGPALPLPVWGGVCVRGRGPGRRSAVGRFSCLPGARSLHAIRWWLAGCLRAPARWAADWGGGGRGAARGALAPSATRITAVAASWPRLGICPDTRRPQCRARVGCRSVPPGLVWLLARIPEPPPCRPAVAGGAARLLTRPHGAAHAPRAPSTRSGVRGWRLLRSSRGAGAVALAAGHHAARGEAACCCRFVRVPPSAGRACACCRGWGSLGLRALAVVWRARVFVRGLLLRCVDRAWRARLRSVQRHARALPRRRFSAAPSRC